MEATTKQAGHTPGPWVVHVAASTRHGYDIQTEGGDSMIAYNLKSSANAKLMAASPDLLAELQQMTDAYAKAMQDSGVTRYPEALAIVRSARAAIAKATD